jgi:competence protein ComGC
MGRWAGLTYVGLSGRNSRIERQGKAMRNKQFKKLEVVLVAAILCVVSVMTLPTFSGAKSDDRVDGLCGHLQQVRSQLSLYHAHHNNQWPRLATFAEQMTGATNVKGTTDPADGALIFGPYLKTIPVNPFTGGNSIDGGDWLYDEATGRFIADDGGATQGITHRSL